MAESTIQPEPFPRNVCMFDIIELKIDSDTSSTSFFLTIVSAYEDESCYILSHHLSFIFLNCITNVATNLNLSIQTINLLVDF